VTSLAFKRRRMWPLARMVRRAIPVPLGWHTRYMVASYCRHTFLVTCAFVTIALSIDLTFFLSKVLATITQQNESVAYLGWYLVLRGTDFLAELLPLACFFGVYWTEIAHTASHERLIVWLSGRTPQQCLLPALLFGALVGCTQLALNYYLRPYAVMTMAENHLGSYGERFDPRPLPYPQWFALGHNLLQAIVEPGEPPLLREVRIYSNNNARALQTFFWAKAAKPLDRDEWLLLDGYKWSPPQNADQSDFSWNDTRLPVTQDLTPFAQERFHLDLSPVWLNNNRINARYLTNDVFSALEKEHFTPDSEFRTWQQARWSLPLFCITMSLLATSLSMLMLAKRIGFAQLAIIACAGYAANALVKILLLLGERGYIHATLAAWLTPLLMLAFCYMITFARRRDTISNQLTLRSYD
jgi:lipopolysaccharide export system permease protein